MEVSCSRCQRRYAVADHKVVGRRRTSRCRCGNLLIFDGRTLSGSELAADSAQPLEPTLTPSEAPAEAVAAPAAPPPALGDPTGGGPTGPLAAELPGRDSQGSTEEAPVESQSIGRIRLRKAEPPSTEAAVEQQRPRAPDTRVDPPTSATPDSLRDELDTLDLDRLAERIRPTWEVPPSRRVTPPGDDPEVVMHYPAEWQPPPSERRRLRGGWEVTPTLPLSLGPQASDRSEGDSDVAPREFASASAPLSPAPDTGSALNGAPLPVRNEAPATRDPLLVEAGSPSAGTSARNNDSAPAAHRRVATPPGSGLESTAPTAVSGLPTAERRGSGAKLWVAGLAAAALVALVWRATSAPSAPPLAPTSAPTPAQVGEVSEVAEGAPPNEPNPPPLVAPPSAAPPSPMDAPSVAPAEDTLAPALAPVAPSTNTPPPAPAAARPSPPSRRAWAESREQPPTSEQSRSDSRGSASPPEPSGAEPTGPDPAQVAHALGVAAARARACSASDPSSAAGSVRVLLNPHGGVLNATALGGIQGTAAGACVESAFRDASTPAYDGRTLSIVYPISLIVD